MEIVENKDSRRMQPLPWEDYLTELGSCITMKSSSGKIIASFWGGDDRIKDDMEWPTEKQKVAHYLYARHACNSFPLIQEELERIYGMEDMPEEAVKAIEALMERVYLNTMEIPPYAARTR